ncbi:hypothetical protein LTR64_003268 [Lithohypha guttulata]|uniref:uncharacterized protein n=1 Tax=Lithohypha guttulata TaxID=1690604 RepID=UPI002DDFEBF2|nr:hypothetical protein LTR51_000512 [Lithohypha guttulata]
MANQGISKSAQKLVPRDPTSSMSIRDVVPNQIATLSTPFHRFGLIKFGSRATIVKLKTGNLAVFSPVALTTEAKAKVEQMCQLRPSGSVRYIVSPDFEHHIFLGPWAKEYPDANIIGPEGLPEKREKDSDTKGLKFSHVFTQANKATMTITPEFDDDFNYEYMHSHQNKELVLFHKPSRTLIEADVIFNLPATEQFSRSGEDANSGILTKLVNGMLNTRGDMKWQKRAIYYGPGSSDRRAFRDSVRKIQSWGEFDRLIPCHGDVIEKGGSRILAEATAWFQDVK